MVGRGLGAGTLEGLLLSSCKEQNFVQSGLLPLVYLSREMTDNNSPKPSTLILKHT